MAIRAHTDPAAAAPQPAVPADTANLTVGEVAADETAKVVGESVAKVAFEHMPPGVKSILLKHPALAYLGLGLRLVPGFRGVVGEGVSDCVGTLHRLASEGTSAQTPAIAPATPVQAQLATAVSVIVAIEDLDQADRDDFMEWYQEADNATGFNRLVAGQDAPAIQKMARMSKPDLEKVIATHTTKQPITFIDLRNAIGANTSLTSTVAAFLTRINAAGQDRTAEFWTAVERRQMKSVAEFESVMNMPTDGEILGYLHMPLVTVKKRFEKAVAAIDNAVGNTPTKTGAAKWAEDLAAKAKSWSQN